METGLIKSIIEGGSVGTCIALIFYMWQRDKMFNKTMNNHLSHETEVKERLVVAITKLTDVVSDCPHKRK